MKNILIGGVFYGLHNIGDEAILYQMLKDFSDEDVTLYYKTYGSEWALIEFPNAVPLKIRDEYLRPKFGIYYKRRPIINAIKKMLQPDLSDFRNKDLYICGGATILSDCPWYSLRTVLLAKKARVPVILWGVGMADIKDKRTLEFIRMICNNSVLKIYTRDEFTQKRLISIGVDKSKIRPCYDPALMLEPDFERLKNELTSNQFNILCETDENICVTLSGEEDIINRTPINEIESYINSVVKIISGRVFLIPTGCGMHCYDRNLLRQLAKHENTVFIEQELSPQALIALLSKMRLVISSRLHLNIFAAIAGTPSIGLVRNSKIVDFAKLFLLSYKDLYGLKADELIKETEIIFHNYDDTIKEIDTKLGDVRNIHNICVNEVKQLMNASELDYRK